ncbi:MAG: glycosyltransferase family 4 protein [Bacteroidales bacterium]|nr:glycosyltransferase family 4 protein [Bacteroidales bacterium]MBN2821000.1 glycosyltransferase family 4 protein [Bacteroidales bacterium]
MNIAVNTRLLLPGKLEGLGRFTYETLKRITKEHPEHNFIFIFDRKYSEEFIFSKNIIPVVASPQSRHPVLWYLFFDWGIPPVLKKYNADLFFSPDGWLSLRTNVPSLPVIHDLNFFHNPQWIEWAPLKYYNYFFPKFIKKAERIATVSEFSKRDIISRFDINEHKIDVVYNGISDGFKPLSDLEKNKVKNKYTAGKDFFLFVGLVHPRKNLSRVIESYSLFRRSADTNTKLLIVGSTKYMTKDVSDAYNKSKYKNDILFAGRIPDSELKKLTASALAQVYASLFEGFGIPILEAMACHTPVITSNVSSMPEVGGDAVIYVDPLSIDSIAEAMKAVSASSEKRDALIKKSEIQLEKFSWDKTAGLVWKSIENCVG